MEKGKLEAWSEANNGVKIGETWYNANEDIIESAKTYGKSTEIEFEHQAKELTKISLIKPNQNKKQNNALSEDVSIRMSALKSAVASTSNQTISAEGFITRAQVFEKYLRGDSNARL